VLATAANPNGLIGASGRIGQKHQIAALMDSLAPHYGDDYWFIAHHAMALSGEVPEDAMGRAARDGNFVALDLTDGVPDAPAERLEQVPRRPGPR